MSSKHIRGGPNLAWPTAEIAVMGPKGASEIIFKKEIAEAKDREREETHLVQQYTERFANPYEAAAHGYIDEVNEPRFTRKHLITALRLLRTKRDRNPAKKHGNIPL